jgi:quinol monooxygenase YgiN
MNCRTLDMSFVAFVTWNARPGEEAEVERVLEQLARDTRAEPGCLEYVVHRSREEPSRFAIYERYVCEEDFRRHVESEHFRTLAIEDGFPRLESRSREFFAVYA